MPRFQDRPTDALRPVRITRRFTRHAEGSVLVEFGETRVLCTASVEEKVPAFLKGKGSGWVTAEYGMLPRATHTRGAREAAAGKQSGRTQEIQRLIGRALRAVTDLPALGERQVTIDCDVLQADGGTRCASITGAMVALADAVAWLKARGRGHARAPARLRGRGVGGHRGRRAVPRPRLRGGFGLRHRHERRDDGRRRLRRGAGHRRGRALLARARWTALLALATKGIAEIVAMQKAVRSPRPPRAEAIVIASNNAGKLAELSAMLGPLGFETVPQGALGVPEAEEPHHTFVENALAKARNCARHTGLPALADDSGLCVEALGGAPGVHSAYFAGRARLARGPRPRQQRAARREAARAWPTAARTTTA